MRRRRSAGTNGGPDVAQHDAVTGWGALGAPQTGNRFLYPSNRQGHSMNRIVRMVHLIDRISFWSGRIVSFLILPMVAGLVYEVVSRYFFNAPTIWANDISTILYGVFWMGGTAYALQAGQHIRTDFLYEKWSVRTKGIVDATLYILFYFPGLGIFLFVGGDYAWRSVLFMERIISSPWMPYIWPLKLVIPIATFLLLLQGVSELLKSLHAARTGQELQLIKSATGLVL